jgi:DNA-binding LacI/PurR family transcriptional regulator
MPPTIVDVARQAGVSYQTVSNVINGRFSQMTDETCQRVLRVIQDLGYHPNQRARSLRRRRGDVIGFLTIDPSTNFIAAPFTSQIISGIADVADQANYSVMVQAIRPRRGYEDPPPHLFSRLFREHRLDGAIVALSGPRSTREKYLQVLADGSFPFILIQERFFGPSNACVLSGDFQGGVDATSHLVRLGHRTIGFITEDTTWPALEARQAGYQAALGDFRIESDSSLVETSPEDPGAVALAMDRLFNRYPHLTAVICFNDVAAMGAIEAVRRRGLRVPEDISIVGFDDFSFAAYLNPPLTTVRLRGYDVGKRAAELLIDYFESDRFSEAEVVFPATLEVRQSTTTPATSRRATALTPARGERA